MVRILTLTLALVVLGTCQVCGQKTFDVWPADRIPGLAKDETPEIIVEVDERIGQKVKKVSKPAFTVYQPTERQSEAAMIICPGGGYNILALDLEGVEVAKWLNSLGMTAIVLQYRVPRGDDQEHRFPLADAQRTISTIRQRAAEWKLNPQQIGIMGFSAGGHLTANASTNYEKRAYDAIDEIDKVSCRPDFFMLVYPAYLVKPKEGPPKRREFTTQLVDSIPVNEKTPPALMIHTANDRVTCNSSIGMFLALTQAKVESELHLYPTGGHGYGLRPSEHNVSTWPNRAADWLRKLGLFDK